MLSEECVRLLRVVDHALASLLRVVEAVRARGHHPAHPDHAANGRHRVRGGRLVSWEGGYRRDLGGVVVVNHAVDLLGYQVRSGCLRCIWLLRRLLLLRRRLLLRLRLCLRLRLLLRWLLLCRHVWRGGRRTHWGVVALRVVIALGRLHDLIRLRVIILRLLGISIRLEWLGVNGTLRYLRQGSTRRSLAGI